MTELHCKHPSCDKTWFGKERERLILSVKGWEKIRLNGIKASERFKLGYHVRNNESPVNLL